MDKKNNEKISLTTGDIIREMRKKYKLSQEELAKLCGLNRNSIYKYEKNETLPKLEQLSKIAEVFNLDLKNFIDVIEYKSTIPINNLNPTFFESSFDNHTIETYSFPIINKKEQAKAAQLFKQALQLIGLQDEYPFADEELIRMLYSTDFSSTLSLLHYKYTHLHVKDNNN